MPSRKALARSVLQIHAARLCRPNSFWRKFFSFSALSSTFTLIDLEATLIELDVDVILRDQ